MKEIPYEERIASTLTCSLTIHRLGKSDCNLFTGCIAESRYYIEYEE